MNNILEIAASVPRTELDAAERDLTTLAEQRATLNEERARVGGVSDELDKRRDATLLALGEAIAQAQARISAERRAYGAKVQHALQKHQNETERDARAAAAALVEALETRDQILDAGQVMRRRTTARRAAALLAELLSDLPEVEVKDAAD